MYIFQIPLNENHYGVTKRGRALLEQHPNKANVRWILALYYHVYQDMPEMVNSVMGGNGYGGKADESGSGGDIGASAFGGSDGEPTSDGPSNPVVKGSINLDSKA